ncbi:MAG: hypothetical protein HY537_05640 [Deltaproteobacteria bacterium]|nr:hypothetical protein [Deltaproteobacteria bacterium]
MKYLIGLLIFISTGCATVGQSALMGAGVGAAAGTGIGIAAERSVGSALIGAGIGATLGSALFYIVARAEEKKDALTKVTLKDKSKGEQVPMLTMPDVVCHELEGALENSGTKWVGPHQVCEIKKTTVFSK